MKEKMKMTAEGLSLFERIIRSCPPRMSNSGLQAKERLFALSKSGKSIFVSDFLERLEIKDPSKSVFGHFFNTARKLGVDEIDEAFAAATEEAEEGSEEWQAAEAERDRALAALDASGYFTEEQMSQAQKVLRAAAMTYVAALATSMAQLLRLLAIFGGNSRRRD